MKVFVTGVTGFLGSHVAETLLRSGHDVVALARDPSRLDPDLAPWSAGGRDVREPDAAGSRPDRGHLDLVRGSLSDPSVLAAGIAGAAAVVHVAGLIQAAREAEFMRVNRDGTDAVLSAALKRAGSLPRFVLISSQAAGGPSRDGRPLSGGDPSRPVSAYGRSKRAGEEAALARAGALPVTVLRPSVIFGPRDRMLCRFFRAVGRGRMVVWRDGSNRFNVVFAPDVARAVLLALQSGQPSGSIVYVTDDRVFTWTSFAETLAGTIGAHVRTLRVPAFAFAAAAAASTAAAYLAGKPPLFSMDKLKELREPAWVCSSEGARALLGWTPSITVEEALASTHAWYRDRGLL